MGGAVFPPCSLEGTKKTWSQKKGAVSDPTRDWTRIACECLGVSGWGMGQQWPAMGSGALNIGPCLHPFEGGHHYPTHLEPGILALGSITMNKASEGDGIPVELFQILKDDAVKVLYSIFQQIWKTQQWPQDWKRSVFIPIPKKGNAKACSNYQTSAFTSQASKLMLKILQARLQQYVNRELPDVQAGFRKGRGTRDQIANIHWIMEKAREFQKYIHFCFIDNAKAFDYMNHNEL